MSLHSKRVFVNFLKVFNVIGLIAILVLTFVVLSQIKKQALVNHEDTRKAVIQIEKDHDIQNKYLQCLVNLFIQQKDDIVTPDQSAQCLAATRSTEQPTTAAIPTNGSSSMATEQPLPFIAQETPQTATSSPTTTTSEPPEPPAPTTPSILDQVTSAVTKLLGGL